MKRSLTLPPPNSEVPTQQLKTLPYLDGVQKNRYSHLTGATAKQSLKWLVTSLVPCNASLGITTTSWPLLQSGSHRLMMGPGMEQNIPALACLLSLVPSGSA
jgi:hypothetical protein